MTIERMSVVWEEHNGWEALRQGMGSLFAASLSYLAMINAQIEHLFFVFPELILFLIAAMLWLGRYRGYRLTELFRFNTLFEKKKSA
ncbi:MAG: 7TM domain-containing protein, partial [Gammaproteobacteria bacterium]